MRLVEALAELVAPTRCAGCELPGSVLCEQCSQAAASIDPVHACPRCGAPYGRIVCTECWNRVFAFEAAMSVGVYERELARAVALHKDAPERRLGHVLGQLLGARIAEAWRLDEDVVCRVPASPRALRRRGFDHAETIGREAAVVLEAEARRLLVRHNAADQRRLGRAERALNVAGSFGVAGRSPPRVVLVDDVFTTGATLDAATQALLEAGCERVRVATVARTW